MAAHECGAFSRVAAAFLLPALVAGLVVYELVHVLARALKIFRIHHRRGQLAAVGIVAFGVAVLLTIAGRGNRCLWSGG